MGPLFKSLWRHVAGTPNANQSQSCTIQEPIHLNHLS